MSPNLACGFQEDLVLKPAYEVETPNVFPLSRRTPGSQATHEEFF